VVLTRQFRFPVFTHGHDGYLIEAAAGLLDNASPEARIVAEAEEETGFRVTCRTRLHRLYEPRLRHRKTLLFIAEYQADDRQGDGGGWRRKVRTLKYWSGRWRGRCRPFAMARSWMLKPLSCCNTWR
jgi:8-oxo-dGTP pyrophosphatase MutT (NUDIX family)